MDPIHLKTSELGYELRIRGIIGLSNIRTGTRTLHDILKKEALGIEVNPVDSSAAFAFGSELIECGRIVKTINETIDIAKDNCGSILWTEAEHRILHLKGRLKRIRVQEIEDSNKLHGLRMDCDNLVRRIADGGKVSVGNRISFIIPSEKPTVELGATARAPQPAATSSEVLSRTCESMGVQGDFHGFSEGDVNPMSRSTGFISGGRGRGRGRTPAQTPGPGSSMLNRQNRIPTPPSFTERLRIPTSLSSFGLDQVGATGDFCHSGGNGINWENERNLGSTVPTYNRDAD